MTADRLREAARVLRERAEAATCQCGGPSCTKDKWFHRQELDARFYEYAEADASGDPVDFIATMHPGVALAVADWLDMTATRGEEIAWRLAGGPLTKVATSVVANEVDGWRGALAVADQILGAAA